MLKPCPTFCAVLPENSDPAENASSSSAEADSDSDSSQAQTSAESDEVATPNADDLDEVSGTKRLQDLSEDDYEEPEEPRIDVEELVQ